MKKPINLAALVIWWVGALFIVADIPVLGFISAGASQALINHPRFTTLTTWVAMWAEARYAVLPALQFIAIGFAIELLDQIRWNALPPEQQIPRRPVGDVIRHLRSWPRGK